MLPHCAPHSFRWYHMLLRSDNIVTVSYSNQIRVSQGWAALFLGELIHDWPHWKQIICQGCRMMQRVHCHIQYVQESNICTRSSGTDLGEVWQGAGVPLFQGQINTLLLTETGGSHPHCLLYSFPSLLLILTNLCRTQQLGLRVLLVTPRWLQFN